MERAEVDHIAGSTAVLLVQDLLIGVPLDKLPEGTREGTHLWVALENDEVISADIDHDRTQSSRKRLTAEMRLLRESPPRDPLREDPEPP